MRDNRSGRRRGGSKKLNWRTGGGKERCNMKKDYILCSSPYFSR